MRRERGVVMKKIENVAVIGLGAVGCAYVTVMADHLPAGSIQAIATGERAERLRRNGIVFNGKRYDFPVVESNGNKRPADLVFVAVKNPQLAQAVEDMRDFVGDDTIIIAPLNGVTSERILGEHFGAEKVLYSYAMKIDATRTGNSTICANTGFIPFGDAHNEPGHYSENVRAVAEFFDRAGVEYQIPEDMIRSLWMKFMLNVGVNQTSATLRFPYGLLQRSEYARNLMRTAMSEAVAVSCAEGIMLNKDDIEHCIRVMDMLSGEGKTSMLQDIEARRPTEVDAFAGAVIELGEKHGIDVPLNRIYLSQIRALEESFILERK